MKDKLPFGEQVAIYLSRFMATWIFILGLFIFVLWSVHFYSLLAEGKPIDIFNLCISLYTLFVDLIILKAAISLRNLDRSVSDIILKIDKRILKQENETHREIEQIHSKVNMLVEKSYAYRSRN